MAVNKIVYGKNTLIDLTSDTVTPEMLFAGYTAHKADGTVIVGTLFDGYPDEQCFYNVLCDSDGNEIKDSSGNAIEGKTVYRKV